MRRLVLGVVPLLLAACDRAPLAPAASMAAPLQSAALQGTSGATAEWVPWEITLPSQGATFFWDCLGRPATLFGGVSGRSHFVTRPDGRVTEVWWTLQLWESWRLVSSGETWRPVEFKPRQGVTKYDSDGTIVADHGRAVIFTLQNEVTGAQIDWHSVWQFKTNANGDVTVDFTKNNCKVRS